MGEDAKFIEETKEFIAGLEQAIAEAKQHQELIAEQFRKLGYEPEEVQKIKSDPEVVAQVQMIRKELEARAAIEVLNAQSVKKQKKFLASGRRLPNAVRIPGRLI